MDLSVPNNRALRDNEASKSRVGRNVLNRRLHKNPQHDAFFQAAALKDKTAEFSKSCSVSVLSKEQLSQRFQEEQLTKGRFMQVHVRKSSVHSMDFFICLMLLSKASYKYECSLLINPMMTLQLLAPMLNQSPSAAPFLLFEFQKLNGLMASSSDILVIV